MRHLILFIGLLGAAGCASLSSNSETYDILNAKIDRTEEIEGFNFTGKFVTFINDKGFSGNLAWDSNPNNDFVKIYNCFVKMHLGVVRPALFRAASSGGRGWLIGWKRCRATRLAWAR